MSVIERIFKNKRCEVYISLMYESINRFITTPEFEPHLDELFGHSDWRHAKRIEEPEGRRKYLYELYENQLRAAGAGYVVHFDLYEGNRLVYSIFFGTQHPTGCDRMKQAIWRVDPFGDFEFRGTKSDQLTLGLKQPDFEPLKAALRNEFSGKGWVGVEEVATFVQSDRTDYHSGQMRQGALRPMEMADEIEVDEGSRRRKRTYPEGARLRFL